MSSPLLERQTYLDLLSGALAEAAAGSGRVVLVAGEAGIGKTSLVEAFLAAPPRPVRALWGACEALKTPRPLGPLHDIAAESEQDLAGLLEANAPRPLIFARFLEELEGDRETPVAVFEDVHWADEATLDLLKYAGRRIQKAGGLLIATYRSDEIGADHPLRHVLGDLPPRSVVRLDLKPLSPEAVAVLARDAGRAPGDLHGVTGGNPFFVTEALAEGAGAVPATVRDAVLTRLVRLSEDSRKILELLSVVPSRCERWLVDRVLQPEPAALERCLASGMLRVDGDALAFRHELARRAVEDVLLDFRRRDLHAAVLRALSDRAPAPASPARLVHHAAGAGDSAALLRAAPEAARQAAALGAHREAASHYRTALELAGDLPAAERAGLLEGLSYECYLTGQTQESAEARARALEVWTGLGNREKEGTTLRWLSRLSWFLGRKADADRFGSRAVETLETLPPGPELAMAYSNRAQLEMLEENTGAAREWGAKAIDLGERFGSPEILSHALNNVGTAELMAGLEAGRPKLEKSLRLALDHGFEEHAARAYTNLGASAVHQRDFFRGRDYLDRGIIYTTEHDLDAWIQYMKGWRAIACLIRGQWAEAAEDAAAVLDRPGVPPVSRIQALTTLGRIRGRRGDPGANDLLDEADELARNTDEIQRLALVAAARAECLILADRPSAAAEVLDGVWDRALTRPNSWTLGELALLRRLSGVRAKPPDGIAEPFARHLSGDWRGAAALWETIGCPWERALALADGDEEAQRDAIRLFDELDARPAADLVRRKLKEQGVRGIPRGPRAATRENPFGLTGRQLEILHCLADGLTNAEIAGRLFISAKTVDHHVSAVLARMDVKTRAEAVAVARRAGLPG